MCGAGHCPYGFCARFNKVSWYACGPTVYDDAHLGHARNYVSTDIIRRILQRHFGYKVHFVMNITDVDDKIILAARQQHLLKQWTQSHEAADEQVRKTTDDAFQAYVAKNLSLLPPEVRYDAYQKLAQEKYGHVLAGKSVDNNGPPGDKEAKIKMHLRTAEAAAQALDSSATDLESFVQQASGVLLPYIDSLQKHTVKGEDHKIFTALTQKYEDRFFDDMKALNVLYPDKVTRVTEYGDEIIRYVQQIQENGFAYAHEGSVYYDTTAWEKQGGTYARLKPENRNDQELQADGEGSLSAKNTGFKKSNADFALWKASKEGEPSWTSPWGPGRPGWHIECSAMASDVLGKQMDIHSGGIDLAFPHHDNELAQSEAYWHNHDHGHIHGDSQWVNYFMHMGHLSIAGSKMSKSLKNFTTIREAIAQGAWTPRGLRIAFLLGAWKDGLEITEGLVKMARNWEESVDSLFINVRDAQQRASGAHEGANGISNGLSGLDIDGKQDDLAEALEKCKADFHDAMADSFNTPEGLNVITRLIAAYNNKRITDIPHATLLAVGSWITEIVTMLGLDAQAEQHQAGEIGWSGIDIPADAKDPVSRLSAIRNQVRLQAKAGNIDISSLDLTLPSADNPYAKILQDYISKIKDLSASTSSTPKDYLSASDWVRDTALWDLGIYLEDRDALSLPALIRPLSSSLREERSAREKFAAEKAAAKAKAQEEAATKLAEQEAKAKVSHLEMFRTSEYTAWDAEGLPTHDAEGKEVAKSKGKKLRKDWERQKKVHEVWLARQKGD
ncbi:hypothetical protein EJ03DRAFT_343190 [Teratosphaeria nubilosa]|uniref:cysteine--tRNA ligase n=1 Tax=Teratosphaeria nubilosa TaxID=161662 RepID=A0A6G1LAR5_9PEZI|nr:hypothetical protein EJ03DRAFT_343190 [Teratosphaeria nubilosa]